MDRQEELIRKITKEKLDKQKLNKANFSSKLINDGLNKLDIKKGIDREKLSLSEKVIKKEINTSNISYSKNQESSNVKLERAENTSKGSISEKKIELDSDSGVNKIVFGSLVFILLIGVVLIFVVSSNSGTGNVDEFVNNSEKLN